MKTIKKAGIKTGHALCLILILSAASSGCCSKGYSECTGVTSSAIESSLNDDKKNMNLSSSDRLKKIQDNNGIRRFKKSFSAGKIPQEAGYINVLGEYKGRERVCTRYTGCAGRSESQTRTKFWRK